MSTYTAAFEAAIDHCMLYEVGGFWNENAPAVAAGLIDTPANRRAVGYVNDPRDHGGETKFGIARSGNPDLDITNLTWEQAKAAYYVRYWLAGKCDKIPGRVAVLHFDGCVNNGVSRACKFLQHAVGATADGVIGQATLDKVASYDEFGICRNISKDRTNYYKQIAAGNPAQRGYLPGWLRRIAEVTAFVLDPNHSFD